MARKAPIGLHERPPDDPLWPDYQAAMAQLAGLTAEAVARAIPVEHARGLLDLVGGPGLHAAAMCRRHRGLQATVVELEAPAELARERLAREGPTGRIHYQVGDLFAIELGTGCDVVTAHLILNNLEAERRVELLRCASAALQPDGILAVLEAEQPPPGRPGSLIATVGSLGLLTFTATRCWTATSCATSSLESASPTSRNGDRSSSQATSSCSAGDLVTAERRRGLTRRLG